MSLAHSVTGRVNLINLHSSLFNLMPYMCVCMYIYISMCVCVYIYIYLCVCIYINVCVCICVCVYIYLCVCIYVYIYKNVCVSMPKNAQTTAQLHSSHTLVK